MKEVRLWQRELDEILEKQDKAHPKTLLLHSCCAPCSSYCLEYLSEYFKILVCFYNPNILNEEEYAKRAKEMEKLLSLASYKNEVKLIVSPQNKEDFLAIAKGLEKSPERGDRCYLCYEIRLKHAALMAQKLSADYFTTTLSISPQKNADWINEIGERISGDFQVPFLFSDFKKKGGFKRSIELSSAYDLYRQNFCGCPYSLKESEEKQQLKKKECAFCERRELEGADVRLVVTDIDDTLLTKDKTVTGETLRMLKLLEERKVPFVLATGRGLSAVPEHLKALPALTYLITSNGAQIYEKTKDGWEKIRHLRMEEEAALALLSVYEEEKTDRMSMECFMNGEAFGEEAFIRQAEQFVEKPVAAYIRGTRKPVKNLAAWIRAHIKELDCINLRVFSERDRLMVLRHERLKSREDFYMTAAEGHLLEYAAKDCGKDRACAFLIERLGLKKEHLAAFGDGENDSDMLREAGYGFAMKNAVSSAKRAADYITRSCEEDGVAYALSLLFEACGK